VALANPVDGLGATAPPGSVTAGSGLRPCSAIVGSVLAFALLIERAGFLAAVMVTVLLASLGSRELRVRQALILAVAVAAVMAVLFVGVLDQPFKLVAAF
jgi:hypothetical protein